MNISEAQLRDQVKVLSAKFLVRTEGQIVQLREQLQQLRLGNRAALQSIQEVAHKIHGSGAMFGFATLSEHGGAIERLSTPDSPPGIEDQLNSLIDALSNALTQELTSR